TRAQHEATSCARPMQAACRKKTPRDVTLKLLMTPGHDHAAAATCRGNHAPIPRPYASAHGQREHPSQALNKMLLAAAENRSLAAPRKTRAPRSRTAPVHQGGRPTRVEARTRSQCAAGASASGVASDRTSSR